MPFQGPAAASVIVGADAVRTYQSAQFGVTKDIRIQRHLAADKHAVTLFDFDTVHGTRYTVHGVVPVLAPAPCDGRSDSVVLRPWAAARSGVDRRP
ncbi:MAG: hypothetical protein ABJB17_02420 [Burkholderiales bacterium]